MNPKRMACNLWIVLLSITPPHSHALSQDTSQLPSAVCGHWTVKRILPTTNVQAPPNGVKNLLGAGAVYLPSEMRFGRRILTRPIYKVATTSEDDFLQDFGLPLKKLGITEKSVTTVAVLNSSGRNPVIPGSILFVRSHDTLITVWDGVFLELVRKGPPCPE